MFKSVRLDEITKRESGNKEEDADDIRVRDYWECRCDGLINFSQILDQSPRVWSLPYCQNRGVVW